MVRKRKAQRNQEHAEAECRVWEVFRPKLDAAQTLADALQLATQTPPPNAPGRRYYSNLAFFLQCFGVPGGSSYAEKSLYLQFDKRLDATGVLNAGACQKIEEDLRRAMEAESSFST